MSLEYFVRHPFTVERWKYLQQLMSTQDPITVSGFFPMVVTEMSVSDWVIYVVFRYVERVRR